MTKIAYICAAALLSTVANDAQASSQGGYITNVYTMDGGTIIFEMTGNRDGTIPACGSSYPSRWAFNGATSAGQVKVANLLTAFSARNMLYVLGKPSCSAWGDAEDVDYFNNARP